jgi:hypothetical protein
VNIEQKQKIAMILCSFFVTETKRVLGFEKPRKVLGNNGQGKIDKLSGYTPQQIHFH